MMEMSEESTMCEICRVDLENPVHFCNESHPPVCRGCMVHYIDNKLNSAFMGSCPTLYCPSSTHTKSKKRKILVYSRWKSDLPNEFATKYNSLANSVLLFLCGGCHSLKTLDVGYESNQTTEVYTKIEKILSDQYQTNEKYQDLQNHLTGYCAGDYNLEEFYIYIQQLFPLLASLNDAEAWDIFSKILKMIPDPERRGNLHLRYLRDRPRMKTPCCNREHCFKCKIKDYHEGKTCAESTESLDHSVVTCPSCGIALARGDGCNTITCVCGKQFSWTTEKENTERSQQFLQAHPEQTSTHCAIVLCAKTPAPLLTQAKAWQARNRIEVNRCLTDYFKRKYWPCPSQCCAVLIPEHLPDGIKEAIDLWKNMHSTQVQRCKDENDLALRSIFLNLYPVETERPIAAHRLVSMGRRLGQPEFDPKIIQSASKWVEKNREMYKKGVEEHEERLAKQFLFLFGNKSVRSTLPSYVASVTGQEWCRNASNPELTYTNNNTTVERVGSVSCYPAAFCKLPGERSTFKVVVDAAPKTSNWLTFGVAKKGMANSSSDGVGRTSNTWGISDDRSSSSGNAIVASSGTEVAQFRKFQVGDILAAQIDVVEGWVEVSVNEDEFIHRFNIPPGTSEDYYFAMSFANDHRVTILADPSGIKKSAPCKAGELNSDHTVMYNNLKKQLRLILTEENENTNTYVNSNLITDGAKWAESCGGRKFAQETYESMRPSIESLLNIRKDRSQTSIEKEKEHDPLQKISWNNLLEAVSWYRHNRDQILQERRTEMGLNFSVIHGEDAAFMAAINLTEYHTHKVEKEENMASLAYMHMFPEEAHAWYDYNASLKEPVIENIAKGCRCLPRHNRTCPLAPKK